VIEGALILIAGLLIGRFMPARRRGPKPPKPRPEPKPICGCTHGIHTHDPNTKRCQARVEKYRHDGIREVMDGYAACACVHHSGPTPYPEFYAPEIGG
jgi:hypothetical protein